MTRARSWPRRFAAAAGSLLALAAITLGVPALMVAIGAVPHHLPTLTQVWAALRRRDDGRLLFTTLAAGVWACWALFTMAAVREAYAAARGRTVRPARSLIAFHRPAAGLVAAIAVLFTTAPALLTTLAPAHAEPPRQPAAQRPDAAPAREPHTTPTPTPALARYLVQRHDTLWGIAARHLGDPLRYREIAALNPDVITDSDRIRPGWLLALPADATGLPAAGTEEVTVHPGDTLSGIAADHGETDWQPTWLANADRPEPGGDVFTDPDVIKPGWTITLHDGEQPPQLAPAGPRVQTPKPEPTTKPTATAPVEPTPTPAAESPSAKPQSPAADRPAAATSGTDWAGVFADGAALAAAGLLAALLRHRRAARLRRRPGQPVPGTRPELATAEKALLRHGEPARVDVAFLDHALRALTAHGCPLPDLLAARLSGDRLELVLATGHTAPPPPWTADDTGTRWTLDRAAAPTIAGRAGDLLAPYPALASIGQDEDGAQWLLDLERAGALSLAGDPQRCRDLARFLACELAYNAWSEHLTVTLVGFGQELVDVNPHRLRHSDSLEDAAATVRAEREENLDLLAAGRAVLADRAAHHGADAWMPQVLLIDATDAHSAELDKLAAALRDQADRSATAVVLAGDTDEGDDSPWRLTLTSTGLLTVPRLQLTLTAHRLPAGQAADLARLLTLARPSDEATTGHAEPAGDQSVEVPPSDHKEITDHPEPAVITSGPGETLTTTTPPPSSDHRPRRDASLDEDLALWHDPDCPLPRLTLLGPVAVRAHGATPARPAFHTEVIAYLATRTSGVTVERLATDLWPEDRTLARNTPTQAVSLARAWLGPNPRTGRLHLPKAANSRGGNTYRVEGLLVDADLFRRLRDRGDAAGPDGIADLRAALALVTGPPFDQRRSDGYIWLVDRHEDHDYTAMISDAAAALAAHGLRHNDAALIREACDKALRADVATDQTYLDLIAASHLDGHPAEAQAHLRALMREHDANDDADLPASIRRTLRENGWLPK